MTDPDQAGETLEGIPTAFVGLDGLVPVPTSAEIDERDRNARHRLAGAALEEQTGDGDGGLERNLDRLFTSFADDQESREVGQHRKLAGRLQVELEPADGDRGEGESAFVVGRRLHVAGRLGRFVRVSAADAGPGPDSPAAGVLGVLGREPAFPGRDRPQRDHRRLAGLA